MANGGESWNQPVMATSVVYMQKDEGRNAVGKEQKKKKRLEEDEWPKNDEQTRTSLIHLNREIKRTRRADIWNVPSKMDTAHCIFDQCADLAIEALQ